MFEPNGQDAAREMGLDAEMEHALTTPDPEEVVARLKTNRLDGPGQMGLLALEIGDLLHWIESNGGVEGIAEEEGIDIPPVEPTLRRIRAAVDLLRVIEAYRLIEQD